MDLSIYHYFRTCLYISDDFKVDFQIEILIDVIMKGFVNRLLNLP